MSNPSAKIDQDSPLSVEEATPYILSEGDGKAANFQGDHQTGSYKARALSYMSSEQGKELIGCGVFGLVTYYIGYLWTTPNQRPIPVQFLEEAGVYITNLVNAEEYVDSTVPEWELGLVLLLCLVFQLGCGIKYGNRDDTHRTLCVYLCAVPLNELVTWTLKVYVGYLRPSFYALCQPNETYDTCTDDQEWQDGRMSFPSGHASYAFCALTLLHLYLEQTMGYSRIVHQVRLVEQRIVEPPQALRYRIGSLLCLLPIALATFIACSRVVDNKHFPADIVAGGILGAFLARTFHYLWFPDPRTLHRV